MAVDVGSATGYLDLDISGFLANLRTAQSEADRASKNMATKVGNNITGIGKSMTSVGSTLTKSVTVPLLGIGTAGLKVASDFDSAMSGVKAISGATGEEFDALRAKAIELGGETAFSANEVAEAMTEMAKAGWDSQQILDGMSGVLDAAAASGENLGTVSTIVADAITGFGMEAKESNRVADLLTQAANSGTIGINDLGESFKYVAPVAGAMGYNIEDVTTALAAMSKAGIKGSQAGTALRTMLTNMANPTDNMAAAMDLLGVSLYDTEGNMYSLNDLLSQMRTGFNELALSNEEFAEGMADLNHQLEIGNINQSQYNSFAYDLMNRTMGAEEALWAQNAAMLAGKEGMSGLLSVMTMTEEEYQNLSNEMYNSAGIAEETAEVMRDNLSADVEELMGSLESLAITFASLIVPALRDFVQWLTQLVNKFTALSPETQKTILMIAGIAAAIGPVLMVLGKLTSSVGSIITTFGKIPGAIAKVKGAFTAVSTAIGGISAPVVAVVAVIGVLIAAFVNLWKTNEEFRNKMTAIWNQIKGTFDKLCQGIVDRLNKLGFDFENIGEVLSAIWKGFCDLLAPYFEGVFQYIADTFDTIVNVILGVLDFFIAIFTGDWEGAWDAIKGIFESVWNGIVAWFQNIGNTLLGMLDVVLGWFGTTWDETWTNIKQFFVDIWNGITSFFSNVINSIKMAVSNFITTIINFFAQLPTNIANFITNAYNSVVTWVSNMVAKAREMGQNFLNAVVSFFTNLPYKVGYFIGNTLTNIVIWAGNMVTKAREMGMNFLNTVVSFFTQLPGKIHQFITSAWNNVTQWATNMVNKAREMGTNFINNVVSFFQQLPGKVLQFITSALNNVTIWVTNMGNKAREMGTNFINNVVSFMQQLPGKIKQYLDSAINNLKTWVTQMGQKGREAVQSLINNVISAASGIASKVASIGSDIVSGVWNGIKGAAGWFKDQVTSFFSGIVDGVKDALGIGSPSKVFRDEIGRWLPPGVVQGFEAAMPSAMKAIQKDLNKGIDNIDINDISVGAGITVSGFANKLKSIYNDVALWFESIEARINGSIQRMTESLAGLISQGRLIVNSDGTLGYIGYNGFTRIQTSNDDNRYDGNDRGNRGGGDTFIFNSPKAIDEIEAARQMKQTKRDIAEGF